MKWENKGREYDKIAGIICDERNSYYLWGAGVFGQSFYKIFKNEINVKGFLDSNLDKQKQLIEDTKVLSPNILEQEISDENIKIIVCNGWINECFEYLNKIGLKYNINYFHANEFMSVYMLYKKDKIYAISANLAITTKCTLRCEKCMALMPYVKNPQNFTLDQIKEELETYFQWVDWLGILGLGGGDVLVHPNFSQILEYVCKTYVGKKVQDLEIYTNAIIMPSEKVLDLCKNYDVIIRFSDYSKNIPGRQKIKEMVNILEKRGIRYDRAVWDTWYDIGFPQKSNGIKTEKALMEHYNKCITKLCAIILNKKLYFCSVHASAVQAGYCEINNADSFDLTNYRRERKKEFIEFSSGFCEKGYLSYCSRCNGYQNINDKFVPVAKQLKG